MRCELSWICGHARLSSHEAVLNSMACVGSMQSIVDASPNSCPIQTACCAELTVSVLQQFLGPNNLFHGCCCFCELLVLMLAAGRKRALLCFPLPFSSFFHIKIWYHYCTRRWRKFIAQGGDGGFQDCLSPGPGLPRCVSPAPQSTRLTDDRKPSHHPIGAAQGREGCRAKQLAATCWQPHAVQPDTSGKPTSPNLPSTTSDCSPLRLSKAAAWAKELRELAFHLHLAKRALLELARNPRPMAAARRWLQEGARGQVMMEGQLS